MFDRQLAKWHLERQGYLAAMDVHLDASGGVDVFGVKTRPGSDGASVFGIVRGWWYAGAYLTPGLIRNHLQTERRLLDKVFAPERLAKAAAQFGLTELPEKVLFYSKRSPSLAAEAESELKLYGLRVVYLEDIMAEALAQVRYDDRANGTVFQLLAMVKSSHVFKEMVRLARQAERNRGKQRSPKIAMPVTADPQLSLLISLSDDEEEENEMDAT